MKPEIRSVYIRKAIKKQLKIEYDKRGKERPAWIRIKNLPKGTRYLSTRYNHRLYAYQTYLKPGFFLPVDYTPEEMQEFYNEWAKEYDIDVLEKINMIGASTNWLEGEFLVSLLDKYNKDKEVKILDLGAGTGILDEILIKHGYKNLTLVDYSQEMLNKAKKKHLLKACKFIKADLRYLNLNKKYDVICSLFSFGSSSYFKKSDMPFLFKTLDKHLKKGGIFMTLGHTKFTNFSYSKKFKTLESGEHKLQNKDTMVFWVDYFIGRKK